MQDADKNSRAYETANPVVDTVQNHGLVVGSNQNLAITTFVGFTLVELLVVIAVIGILAALLLTVVSRAKGRAQQVQCANNVRQLGVTLQGYVTENHAYPLKRSLTPDAVASGKVYWEQTLQESELGSTRTNSFLHLMQQGVWKCPNANTPANYWEDVYISYGYNFYGMQSDRGVFNVLGLGVHSLGLGSYSPVNESEVVSPSEMIAMGDGFMGGNGIIRDGVGNLMRTCGIPDFGSTARASARHQGKANVVFCDGHVESPPLKFLFEDTSDAALVRWNRDHLPHRDRL
jgi:prepilin-type processing-associated H-X9-DG protein/prepilin-type N-terminal cleavage/methylation domain-containing protein